MHELHKPPSFPPNRRNIPKDIQQFPDHADDTDLWQQLPQPQPPNPLEAQQNSECEYLGNSA